jgi:uracil-DNA glycosylase family 4
MSDALRELAARLDYYRELGIYDFYRRAGAIEFPIASEIADEVAVPVIGTAAEIPPVVITHPAEESAIPRRIATTTLPVLADQPVPPLPAFGSLLPAAKRPAALAELRAVIGDCTRCRLAEGRNKIVFADGDPNARIMFVGEGPGADEDAQGLPFVGRAGQLLNNMIGAMGLRREQVYIANIVKCRPPQNRKPESDEANTCMPFLERQIDIVRPEVLVALGATAATYLLGMRGSIAAMRGRMHDYRGIQTVVTYHPAFLLRDPSQKKETWKDLQMAMTVLGLQPPTRAAQA